MCDYKFTIAINVTLYPDDLYLQKYLLVLTSCDSEKHVEVTHLEVWSLCFLFSMPTQGKG